jgi:hypothetical protein
VLRPILISTIGLPRSAASFAIQGIVGPLRAFNKAGNDRNDPSARIVQQIAGEIGKVEVGLVPGRDYIAEADAVLDRPHQERPEPPPEFDQGDWPT